METCWIETPLGITEIIGDEHGITSVSVLNSYESISNIIPDELLTIPFGKTMSYLNLSKQLGDVKAIRAVAGANGKNPLWIIVPCHRVIGSDGSLTGYAGGLSRKQWLLEHESPYKQQSLF